MTTPLLFAFLFSLSAHAAAFCPATVTLEGPRFLAGAAYPTDAQIETNFRQTFVTNGFRTYDADELASTQLFVKLLARNTHFGTVELRTFGPGRDGTCAGALEGQAFTVDRDGVSFTLGEITFASLGFGTRLPMTLTLSLPSNCSGCVRETELFEVEHVSAQ
jgi:hypothetical protein